jgi:hypothetical protein
MPTKAGDPLSIHPSLSAGGSLSVTSRQGSRGGMTPNQAFFPLSPRRLTRLLVT